MGGRRRARRWRAAAPVGPASAAAGLPVRRRARRAGRARSRPSSTPSPSTPSPRSTSPSREPDQRPLTLRRFLAPHRRGAARRLRPRRLETLAAAGRAAADPDRHRPRRRRRRHAACSSSSPSPTSASIVVSVAGRHASASRFTGRLGERSCTQLRVRVFSPPPAPVARLLHRREGRPADDPHDERHRGAQPALPGGPVNLAVQGLTLRRDHRRSCSPSTRCWPLITLAGRRARRCSLLTLWFRSASDRGYTHGARPHRRRAGRPARRACRASGSSPPTTAAATTSSTTATSSASYRDANLYTARVGAIYGPGDRGRRRRWPRRSSCSSAARMVLDGRLTDRRAHRLRPLPHGVLRPDPAAGPALQHLPAGPGRGDQAAGPARHRARRCPRPPTPSTCPPSRARSSSRTCASATCPASPVLDDVDLRIAPGETFALRRARPARASRPIAKLVTRLLRPDRGRGPASTATTSATSRSTRCAASSASCPRSRSSSTARSATTSPSPAPTPPTTRCCEACRAVGLDDLVERLPEGLDTPVHERGVVAVLGRAPAPRPGPGLPRPARGCSCSTRPRRTSTCVRGQASSGPSTSCSRAAPPSSSPTAWPPPCGPTASRSSTTGGIVELGTHDELVRPGRAATPPCTPPGSATWTPSRARRPASDAVARACDGVTGVRIDGRTGPARTSTWTVAPGRALGRARPQRLGQDHAAAGRLALPAPERGHRSGCSARPLGRVDVPAPARRASAWPAPPSASSSGPR